MKKNITLIFILLFFFIFGLFIYDFSDDLDKEISNNTWYKIEGENLTKVTFEKDKINYLNEDDTYIEEFKTCKEFKYNKSINVLKLDCKIRDNKIYLTSFKDNKLTLKISGIDKTFYKTKEEAVKYNFILSNNLNEEEFAELMEISLYDLNIISKEDLNEMYKSKETYLVSFLSGDLTVQTALNLKGLYNYLKTTTEKLNFIIINDLNEKDYKDLDKLLNLSEIEKTVDKKIPMYKIGNKKSEYITSFYLKDNTK